MVRNANYKNNIIFALFSCLKIQNKHYEKHITIQKEISEYFSTDNVIKIIKEDDNLTTFWTIHSVWRLTLINVPNLVN